MTLLAGRASRAEPPVEVVVEGSTNARGARDALSSSQIVRGDELRVPGASAADVLARLPGIQVSRTGSSSDLATAAIRGATSAQTPVYLAGIRINDDVSGTTDLSALPLFLIDRVEVYRGNAPPDADQLSIGGAIFFEPRLPRRTHLSVGTGAGSFGAWSSSATAALGGPTAGALVAVAHEQAENDFEFRGPNDEPRRRTNADFAATSGWTIARFQPSRGTRVVTVLHAYDREQGSPGLALVPDTAARSRFRRLLTGANVQLPCGPSAEPSACRLQLTTSALRTANSINDPLLEVIPSRAAWSVGERLSQGLRITHKAGDKVSLTAAADAGFERISVGLAGATGTRANRYTARPSVDVLADLTPWTRVLAILSADFHETRSSLGRERSSMFELSGRVGVRHAVSDHVELRSNLGRYTRPPTLGELYGITSTVRGNVGLEPETGLTGDLGVRLRGSADFFSVDADIFAFAREADNLISYRRTGPGSVAPYNVGRARILGAEASLGVTAVEHVRATFALTAMDPRDTSKERTQNNDILPYRSRFVSVVSAELLTKSPRETAGAGASVGARLTHRSSKYADTAGLLIIRDQMEFDTYATVRLFDGRLAARGAVMNVLDSAEFDSIGLPLPGRALHFSMEVRLE